MIYPPPPPACPPIVSIIVPCKARHHSFWRFVSLLPIPLCLLLSRRLAPSFITYSLPTTLPSFTCCCARRLGSPASATSTSDDQHIDAQRSIGSAICFRLILRRPLCALTALHPFHTASGPPLPTCPRTSHAPDDDFEIGLPPTTQAVPRRDDLNLYPHLPQRPQTWPT